MPRLLLVDDSSVLRAIMREVLLRAGFPATDVTEAASVAEALARLEEDPPPRVVLCDLDLGADDGVRLVHALRERSGWERVAILALAAAGDEDGPRRARAAGADGHLVKPFDAAALRAALDACPLDVAGPVRAR